MKTLADFKRALTVGSKWHATYFYNGEVARRGYKTVVEAYKTYVVFREPESRMSTCFYFPKASEFALDGNGDIEFWLPADPINNTTRRLAVIYKQINL